MKMKRYEEYKDSGVEWIGEVPSHWEVVPLKRAITINNGCDYKHVQIEEEGYPVIGSGGQFAWANQYMYDGEVVLLGRKGTIDKPLYYNGKFWTVDTMFYGIPKKNANCKYLFYQAKNIPFGRYATATALPSMTQTDLNNNVICLPPLAEQQGIASYLDKKCSEIDKVISAQQKRIALLQELKQSIITHAVTKGLNPNVEMKDSGVEWIGKVPKTWEIIPFKRAISINNGCDYKHVQVEDDGYPVIGSGGQFAQACQYIYDGEVVLLGRKGTIDKPLYFKGKFWTVDTMFYGIPRKNANCRYLYYQAKMIPFDRYATATALPSMTQTDLNNNPICLPPVEEQEEIVNYLDKKCASIDSSISKAQHQVELLQEYKQSLITEVVTGKRKVS